MGRQRRWLVEFKEGLKFRPQDFSGKFKLRNNPVGQYHFQERHAYTPLHYIRTGGHLHYLADHAPSPIRKKWSRVFRKFCKLHPKF